MHADRTRAVVTRRRTPHSPSAGDNARKSYLLLQLQTREPRVPPGSSWVAGEPLIPREERGPLTRSPFRSADKRSKPQTLLATRTIIYFFRLKIAHLSISRNR